MELTKVVLEKSGYTNVSSETLVPTPGGFKGKRYIDVTAVNPSTGGSVGVNVGRTTKSGQPVARESRALSDIALSGKYSEIYFVEYFNEKK